MLGERLKRIRGDMKQSQFATKFGVHTNTYARYERNEGVPDANFLAAICKDFNINSDWLLFGTGPMHPPERSGIRMIPDAAEKYTGTWGSELPDEIVDPSQPRQASPQQAARSDFGLVMVPKVNARVSAGTGSLETDKEELGLYAFREKWITAKGDPANLVLMEITGNSMSPALEDGDTILVDESRKEIIPGIIYIIGIDDEVVCKELDKAPGKLILRSKNKDYQPIEVDLNDESQRGAVRILGQVIWSCREW